MVKPLYSTRERIHSYVHSTHLSCCRAKANKDWFRSLYFVSLPCQQWKITWLLPLQADTGGTNSHPGSETLENTVTVTVNSWDIREEFKKPLWQEFAMPQYWSHNDSTAIDQSHSPILLNGKVYGPSWFPFIRWFKFTLKPPYRIAIGNLFSAIWDTSHWNFLVKFGLKTGWDMSYDILLSLLKFVNFWQLQDRLSILTKIGCLQKIKVFSMKEWQGFDATWGF